MKRIFALLLVVFMLIPCIVACGQPSNNGGNTTDSGTPGGNNGGNNGGTIDDSQIGSIKSKDTVLTKWSGKELKILATTWGWRSYFR